MKRTATNNEGVSIEEYRKILKDYETPDNKVQERISYLNAFCRNIIRSELERYKSERLSQKCDNIASKSQKENDS